MKIPARWKQSKWLRWLKPIKRWFFPPPPAVPIPPMLVPPHLTGIVEPPPRIHRMAPSERARFLQSVSLNDLVDQIASPDINLRVKQVLNHLSHSPCDIPVSAEHQKLDGKYWDSRHALTWYVWRFRPATYLEIAPRNQFSAAMVALNSQETSLISFHVPPKGDPINNFDTDVILQELTRCGHCGPITFFASKGSDEPLLYLSRRPWRSAAGPVARGDFDVMFVNDGADDKSLYRNLKKLLQHCAPGGMVLVKTRPGNASWARLQQRILNFRYLTLAEANLGLAFRIC